MGVHNLPTSHTGVGAYAATPKTQKQTFRQAMYLNEKYSNIYIKGAVTATSEYQQAKTTIG